MIIRSFVSFPAGKSSVCVASCPCRASPAYYRRGRWASTTNLMPARDARSSPPAAAGKAHGRQERPRAPNPRIPATNPRRNLHRRGFPWQISGSTVMRESRFSSDLPASYASRLPVPSRCFLRGEFPLQPGQDAPGGTGDFRAQARSGRSAGCDCLGGRLSSQAHHPDDFSGKIARCRDGGINPLRQSHRVRIIASTGEMPACWPSVERCRRKKSRRFSVSTARCSSVAKRHTASPGTF